MGLHPISLRLCRRVLVGYQAHLLSVLSLMSILTASQGYLSTTELSKITVHTGTVPFQMSSTPIMLTDFDSG